jgi:hypothetical protein
MSSKSTLASGPNFRLYTDLFDHAGVYLEMAGVKFESSNDWVKVAIPFPIWEVIRQYPFEDKLVALPRYFRCLAHQIPIKSGRHFECFALKQNLAFTICQEWADDTT